jgi:hypothetical protein
MAEIRSQMLVRSASDVGAARRLRDRALARRSLHQTQGRDNDLVCAMSGSAHSGIAQTGPGGPLVRPNR